MSPVYPRRLDGAAPRTQPLLDRFEFVADRGDARLRLDQVVVRRTQEAVRLSRHVVQQWIAAGAVTVGGRTVRRPAAGVADGARIVVTFPAARARARPEPEQAPLDVLHEDDALLALAKPAGIVVHPTYKTTSGTLLNALLWHVRDRAGARPSILTRLDKDTSGVVLVALSPEVHAAVQRAAAAGAVAKQYLAVVRAQPAPRSGTIDLPLGRDPADRRRVVVMPSGAPSRTRYDVVAEAEGVAVVRCELVTGRTHQIRVHLAAKGWPLVGDAVYGVPHGAIARQALHAWRVSLRHPVTGAPIEVTAPLPRDFRELLTASGLDAGSRDGSCATI